MRIVIAEDSAVVRAGLAEILADSDHEVVAAVGNADDLLAAVAEHRPDVAVVDAGGTALDPEVVMQLLGASRRNDALTTLTPRERDVLALMAEGRSNAAIAEILVVSDRSVEKHVGNIFSKLGLAPSDADHRRVLAVLRYLES